MEWYSYKQTKKTEVSVMIRATKRPIYPILVSLLIPLLLAACNIFPNEEPTNIEDITQSQGRDEQRPLDQGNTQVDLQQNQNQRDPNQSTKTQTQEGVTITVTNVTTMGNQVKIDLFMKNKGTDKVLTQLGISQVEQDGQLFRVVDPYKKEYLEYPNGDRDNLLPGESGNGHVVFALPNPQKPFTFKVKPYSFAPDSNMQPFIFHLTPSS